MTRNRPDTLLIPYAYGIDTPKMPRTYGIDTVSIHKKLETRDKETSGGISAADRLTCDALKRVLRERRAA